MSVFFMDFDMAPSVIWARDLYDQMQIRSDFRKSKSDLLDTICTHIDHEIHRNYRLYPNNYIAMDELDGTDHTDHYTEDDVRKFKLYIQSQLAKIKIPNKDEEFLRERLLTMYANPARNYIEAVRG